MKKETAIKIIRNQRKNSDIIYSVVGKVGTNEVVEIHKINIKTNKKEIIFKEKEYKKLKEKIDKKEKLKLDNIF